MKYTNIWAAVIVAISILAGVWIYTMHTRFELTSIPAGAVYKIDRSTGQVWLILLETESEVKSEAKHKAEEERGQLLQKFKRELEEFEKQ